VQKMFKKLSGYILVDGIVQGEFQGDAHEVQAVHCHPACSVGLVDETTRGQWSAAIKNTDVIKAEEAALEDVAALRILAIHPPGEVEHQFVEDALQEGEIAAVAALFAVDLENAPGRPGVDRRIDVAERPFVSGKLAVRMHVPFAREQEELDLGEFGV